MAGSSATLVPANSIDAQGMSIAVANPSLTDDRAGKAWHPATFAAGVPVHFHPLAAPTFLGLFSQRWYSAQINSSSYGQYTSHSVDTDPSWMLIQANTGDANTVNQGIADGAYAISYRDMASDRTLRAATSQGLFLLALTDVGGQTILSRWRSTLQNQIVTMHEEAMSTAGGVTYNGGLYVDKAFCYVWGTDANGLVYTARQVTGKIGAPDDWWQYQSDTGWSSDATQATPVTGLHSLGPVSTFVWRNRTYVTTVAQQGSDYLGQIWLSRSMADPWTKVDEIDLGVDGAYAHQGIVLQPQLGLAPGVLSGLSANVSTAVPYVYAKVGTTGIDIHWDVLQIPA